MPHFPADDLTPADAYALLTSIVVPRPIAWVGTRSPDGVDNVAPHSYFSIASSAPPVVLFTSVGTKDTLTNLHATGCFTISVVSRSQLEAANQTAARVPPEVDEFAHAGLTPRAATTVDAPWVDGAPAHLECRLRDVVEVGDGNVVLGDVTAIEVDEAAWVDGRVDTRALDPVGRLGASAYALLGEITELARPTAEY